MPDSNSAAAPAIIPYFYYADAAHAVEWLRDAFGLESTLQVEGPDEKLMHAEMAYGNGVIMLGERAHELDGARQRETSATRGSGIYVVVTDIDAHYERARSEGADIVFPPEDTDFGTRRYRALDVGGHEWTFGSYQPVPEGEA